MNKFFFYLFLLSLAFAKPDQKIPEISTPAKKIFFIEKAIYFTHHNTNYKIFIATNNTNAKQYKTIYLLDGNAFFPLFLNLFSKPIKEDLLIIGIGYDTPLAFDIKNRTKDYTPDKKASFKEGGGSDNFRTFLKTQLIPYIEQRYRSDKNYKAIFGHSFGGLFALDTLLKDSKLFSHYFIISPSLWWNQTKFLPEKIKLSTCPKIYFALGSAERKRNASLSVKELSQKISQESFCKSSFKLFKNETHGSVINKAMIYAKDIFLKSSSF
ncbi:alpha/beta hydrolase [Campylobacter novaezeelandiae]|uniref:alpha/beta hydrolase n=1 Tax=Campylobacter novaezeelandiae TaxID=2267891 RepID=UPI001037E6A9|nr:alpha/beta hydrolase [Campylobacter novaezeelandiae]QWU80539.1 alpha/beta hydrolase family protein [Campylobacter novaezeelandiae]TBR79900.1 alpha/beta hydrolase [Campylobacter novaezeelandiae]